MAVPVLIVSRRGKAETVSQKQALAAGAAGIALIGSFLDWAKVQTGFGSMAVSGTEGDGIITAACALVAVVLFATGKVKRAVIVGIVFSAIGGAVAIWNLINVSSKVGDFDNEFARASVGIGLYVCVAGFVIGIAMGATRASELVASPPSPLPTPADEANPVLGQAAWLPDPTGRHAWRYWTGTEWSDRVADNGTVSSDSLGLNGAP